MRVSMLRLLLAHLRSHVRSAGDFLSKPIPAERQRQRA